MDATTAKHEQEVSCASYILVSNVAFLSPLVPPAPPEVRDSGGFLLGDTVGPYDEGEAMSITCLSANSGSPPPKLTW